MVASLYLIIKKAFICLIILYFSSKISVVEFLVSGRFERGQYLTTASRYFCPRKLSCVSTLSLAHWIFLLTSVLSLRSQLACSFQSFSSYWVCFSLAYSFMLAVLFLFSGHMIESMMSLLGLVVLARYFRWERV